MRIGWRGEPTRKLGPKWLRNCPPDLRPPRPFRSGAAGGMGGGAPLGRRSFSIGRNAAARRRSRSARAPLGRRSGATGRHARMDVPTRNAASPPDGRLPPPAKRSLRAWSGCLQPTPAEPRAPSRREMRMEKRGRATRFRVRATQAATSGSRRLTRTAGPTPASATGRSSRALPANSTTTTPNCRPSRLGLSGRRPVRCRRGHTNSMAAGFLNNPAGGAPRGRRNA